MTKEKLRTVRTAAAALTLMLTALIITPPQPASAAARYTPVAGGTTTFDKYLIIRAGTQVPHASFSFKAVPGQGQPAASDRPEVLPGSAVRLSATHSLLRRIPLILRRMAAGSMPFRK